MNTVSALAGKRVVLTGAAGGLGSLVAVRLRVAGATVIGVDRAPCPVCQEAIVADLSSAEGLDILASELAASHVDILVNLAGLQYFGLAEEQGAAGIRLGYAVNLVAPVTLALAVLPQMRARKSGQIVNIGSIMGSINYPHFATYSSAKAGLRGFSEALRREVGALGIDVTYVAPRAARTAFNSAKVREFLELVKMKADEPDDVCGAIVDAIERRRKDVFIGFPERLFVALNGVVPRLIDRGLAAQTTKARQLFQH